VATIRVEGLNYLAMIIEWKIWAKSNSHLLEQLRVMMHERQRAQRSSKDVLMKDYISRSKSQWKQEIIWRGVQVPIRVVQQRNNCRW
jgi:hypothetical protein